MAKKKRHKMPNLYSKSDNETIKNEKLKIVAIMVNEMYGKIRAEEKFDMNWQPKIIEKEGIW